MTCNTSAVEPRVLHCDHGLRREILQQRDLLVGKWADFLAPRRNAADQNTVFEEWHKKYRTQLLDLYGDASILIDRVLREAFGKIELHYRIRVQSVGTNSPPEYRRIRVG